MKIFLYSLSFLFLFACTSKPKQEFAITAEDYHQTVQHLTDVIVHDIFSPPAASRVYAYPMIAAYEIMAQTDPTYYSLAGQLNGLPVIPKAEKKVIYELASLEAFFKVCEKLIFSENLLNENWKKFNDRIEAANIDPVLLDDTKEYADIVANHILDWMSKDNYKQTRTFQKYTVIEADDRWIPTPPGYMEAIEPNWNKIRPFVLDSSSQFKPELPTKYDMDTTSLFYKEVMHVYNTVNNLDNEQREIASFWDCNPYVMNVKGHAMFASKKVTPGGHWIGIVAVACKSKNASFVEATAAYALTSLTLMDGFISCWDEKYRSNLVRPETVINRYIDENWEPLLQTPPFPEYTSGHSVISSAAGTVLTDFFGENFHLVDSTEVKYGLTTREFNSFEEAFREAAISRLYGGIHYMPAITNGVTQGSALGDLVVQRIKIKD